jgi:phosphate uptake regulator
MLQRRIQLIAGTTYTVSLPKQWVLKNKLGSKDSVLIDEKEDGTLALFPGAVSQSDDASTISINIDNEQSNISHMIFAMYYMGFDNIKLFSKKEIPADIRNQIKHTIQNLSGVEIVFEDVERMYVKVLLDISKPNIYQLLGRKKILINLCIDNLLHNGDFKDIERNEDDIDRLHHLVTRMILVSSKDLNVLKSSGIGNVSHLMSFLVISKRMENIADNLIDVAQFKEGCGKKTDRINHILCFFKRRLSRDMSLLLKQDKPAEPPKDMTDLSRITSDVDSIKEPHIRIGLSNIAKFLIEIEEEILNLIYYKKLLEGKC